MKNKKTKLFDKPYYKLTEKEIEEQIDNFFKNVDKQVLLNHLLKYGVNEKDLNLEHFNKNRK